MCFPFMFVNFMGYLFLFDYYNVCFYLSTSRHLLICWFVFMVSFCYCHFSDVGLLSFFIRVKRIKFLIDFLLVSKLLLLALKILESKFQTYTHFYLHLRIFLFPIDLIYSQFFFQFFLTLKTLEIKCGKSFLFIDFLTHKWEWMK